jgi:hypothetical protein
MNERETHNKVIYPETCTTNLSPRKERKFTRSDPPAKAIEARTQAQAQAQAQGGGEVVTHHQRQQHRRPQQTADNAVTGRHVRDVALRLSMCRAYFSWSAVRWWYFLRRVGMEGGMCVWIWVWLGRWTVRTGAAAVLAKWGGFGFALLCFAHSCGRGCRCGCGCACGCVRGQLGELR